METHVNAERFRDSSGAVIRDIGEGCWILELEDGDSICFDAGQQEAALRLLAAVLEELNLRADRDEAAAS